MARRAGRTMGVLLLAVIAFTTAATITVESTLWADLSNAILSAGEGDCVQLHAYTYVYDGSGPLLPLHVTQGIKILSIDGGPATIDLSVSSQPWISIDGPSLTLQFLILTDAQTTPFLVTSDSSSTFTASDVQFTSLWRMAMILGQAYFERCVFQYMLAPYDAHDPSVLMQVQSACFDNCNFDTLDFSYGQLIQSAGEIIVTTTSFNAVTAGTLLQGTDVSATTITISGSTAQGSLIEAATVSVSNSYLSSNTGTLVVTTKLNAFDTNIVYANYFGSRGGVHINGASVTTIDNTQFCGNYYTQAIWLNATAPSAALVISNGAFETNNIYFNPLIEANSNVTITSTSFTSNTVYYGLAKTGTLQMDNSNIDNNYGQGGVYLFDVNATGPVTFDTVDFLCNSVFARAVSIVGRARYLTFSSVTFEQHSTFDSLLYLAPSNLVNTTFIGLGATSNTGYASTMFNVASGGVYLEGGTFSTNSPAGGISSFSPYRLLQTNGTTLIRDFNFDCNTAADLIAVGLGAAVPGTTTITGSTFANNVAENLVDTWQALLMHDNDFNTNTGDLSLVTTHSDLTMYNMNFECNTLPNGFGVGAYDATRVSINHVSFRDHESSGVSTMLSVNSNRLKTLSLTDAIFCSNTGTVLAATGIGSPNVTINNTRVDMNTINAGSSYPIIYAFGQVTMVNSHVSGTTMSAYIDVVNVQGSAIIRNVRIDNNNNALSALTVAGSLDMFGAIYECNVVDALINAGNDLVISNSTFTSNTGRSGGGFSTFIFNWELGRVNVQHCTFTSNDLQNRNFINAIPNGANTFIDNSFCGNTNMYHAYVVQGTTTPSISIAGLTFIANSGSAIRICTTNVNSTVIRNVAITGNCGATSLPMIEVISGSSVLIDVNFADNSLGASCGLYVQGSTNFSRVNFVNTAGSSLLIAAQTAVLNFVDTQFINTRTSGLFNFEQSLSLNNCRFQGGNIAGVDAIVGYGPARVVVQSTSFDSICLANAMLINIVPTGGASFTNVTFNSITQANTLIQAGGGSGASLTLRGVTFTNNGGSLVQYCTFGGAPSALIRDVLIVGNSVSTAYPNTLFQVAAAQITYQNVIFTGNTLSNYNLLVSTGRNNVTNMTISGHVDAAVLMGGSAWNIVNSTFTSNTAGYLLQTDSDFVVLNSAFTQSVVTTSGLTAIGSTGYCGRTSITSSVFSDLTCSAGPCTALLGVFGLGAVTVRNVVFERNLNIYQLVAVNAGDSVILSDIFVNANNAGLIQSLVANTSVARVTATANVPVNDFVSLTYGGQVTSVTFSNTVLTGFNLIVSGAGMNLTNVTVAGCDGAYYVVGVVNPGVLSIAGSTFMYSLGATYAFLYTQGDLSVVNSTFEGNTVSSGANALFQANAESTISIRGSIFTQNSVYGLPLLALTGGNVTVANTTIFGNSASYVVHLCPGSSPSVVSITSTTVDTHYGAFLYVVHGLVQAVVLNGVSVTHSFGPNDNFISLLDVAPHIFNNVRFDDLDLAGNSLLYTYGPTNMTGVTLTNSVNVYRAVYTYTSYASAPLNLRDVIFSANSISYMMTLQDEISIVNSVFSYNSVSSVINTDCPIGLSIQSTSFVGNSGVSPSTQFIVANVDEVALFRNVSFVDQQSMNCMVTICGVPTAVVFNETSFINNVGSAFYVPGATLTPTVVRNLVALNNVAVTVFMTFGVGGSLINARISNNDMANMWLIESCANTFTVTNSTVVNNFNMYDMFYLGYSPLTIVGSNITANSMYSMVYDSGSSGMVISGSTFAYNSASGLRGACFLSKNFANNFGISYSTFVHNDCGGYPLFSVTALGPLVVRNSIFNDNANVDNGILQMDGSVDSITFTDLDFFRNSGSSIVFTGGTPSGSVVVRRVRMIGNRATYSALMVVPSGDIDHVQVINNVLYPSGGLSVSGYAVNLTNFVASGNDFCGAAAHLVFLAAFDTVVLRNLSFTNNTNSYGVMLAINYCPTSISAVDLRFIGNSGAALWSSYGGTLTTTINRLTVTNHIADCANYELISLGSGGDLTNVVILNNTLHLTTPHTVLTVGGPLNLVNATITGHGTRLDHVIPANIIYAELAGSTMNLVNCNISSNTASITINTYQDLSITGSTIAANSAINGVIYSIPYTVALAVSSTVIRDNDVSGTELVFIYASTVSFYATTFTRNKNVDYMVWVGGGPTELIFNRTSFTYNDGFAIFASDTSIINSGIHDSNFTDNIRTAGIIYAFLYLGSGGPIDNVRFINNRLSGASLIDMLGSPFTARLNHVTIQGHLDAGSVFQMNNGGTADLLVTGCTIRNNTGTGLMMQMSSTGVFTMAGTTVVGNLMGGGVVFISSLSSATSITGCTFRSNSGAYPHIYAQSTTVYVSNLAMQHNTVGADCGLLHAVYSLEIHDSIFNDTVFNSGNVIQALDITITGSTFSHLISEGAPASFEGSYSAVEATTSAYIVHSNFSQLESMRGVHAPYTVVEHAGFDNVYAFVAGGAIRSTTWAIVSNSTFRSCTACGGAAISAPVQANVYSSSFIGCQGQAVSGGAINAGTLSISLANFTSNTGLEGGAIFANNGAFIDHTTFVDNSACNGGGAAALSGFPLHASYITCRNNDGGAASTASGGGCLELRPTDVDVVVANLTSRGDRGIQGGAIAMYGAAGVFENIDIKNAAGEFQGGGMYIYSANVDAVGVSLHRVNITDSGSIVYYSGQPGGTAHAGGGGLYVYLTGAPITLDTCNFANNYAVHYGGGIYIDAVASVNGFTGTNLTITGNSAQTGGGVASVGSNIVLDASVLSGNTAGDIGGGLYVNSGSYALTASTRITCNTAGRGALAIMCDSATATVDENTQITAAADGAISSTDSSRGPGDSTSSFPLAAVQCNRCAGDCHSCHECLGGCRQAGDFGCYRSESACTTCPTGFGGPTCNTSLVVATSCAANLGCPARLQGQTCRITCNNSYTNPAINLNALGNVTCLNPAAGWPYANACIPCPPHKSGLNCSVVQPVDCAAIAGVGVTTGCPVGYDSDTCTPSCNRTAFYIRNPANPRPLTCSHSLGHWDNVGPLCVINSTLQCPAVTSVPSHATVGTCVTSYLGSNCTLGCQDGYAPSGVALGNCVIQGTSVLWVGHTITCNPVNCNGSLSLPANANAGTCTVGLLGGTCQLGCNVNFAATNPVAGTCTAGVGPTAKWVGQNTTCVPSVCGTVPSSAYPTGGNAGNCSVGSQNNVCYLGCNSGYTASNSVKGVCTPGSPSAAWAGMSIQCTPATCAAVTSLGNGTAVGSCTGGVILGGSCNLGCATGYSALASTPGICTATGPGAAAWSGMTINCTAAVCAPYAALPVSATVGNCTTNVQGSVCLLSCASGYVISNQKLGGCVGVGSTAQWTGLNITCSAAACANATGLPSFATVGTCTSGPKLGASCLLTCQSGYTPSGVVAGTCSAAGLGLATWQGQNIICTPSTCAALSPSSPVTVGTCTSGGSLGGHCAFSCISGYVLASSAQGTCTGCGVGCASWTGATGTCNPVGCIAPSLGSLLNAVPNTCGTASQGATCQLGCANGYIASGVGTATCSACGYNCSQWSPLTITCTAALCPAPAVPANASLGTCTNNAAQGAACNFTCLDGYFASGITQGRCQANVGPTASWIGQGIICGPAPCAPLVNLTAGRTAGSCTTQPVGSSCSMGCANGYISSASLPGICRAGLGATGVWVNMSIVCTPASCAPLSPTGLPSFSTLGTCNSTQILGSSCALDCQYGYVNAGNASSVAGICNGTGPGAAAWKGMDIVCVPPGACTTVNSTVYGVNGTPGNCTNQANGTTCKLGCANGYNIAGFTYGYCGGFTWNGPSITCVAATCPSVSPPANGNVGTCTTGAQGANCNLACNNGFVPSGAVQGTCTLDAGNTASWKNQALVCSAASCPALTGLGTGVLVGTCTLRTLTATCSLSCANGYNMTSVTAGACSPASGPTAAWSGQAITCTPALCDPVTPPLNALVGTCGSAVLGSACNLTCQNGYSASGSQPGSCVAGAGGTATWVGMVIACNPASCTTFSPLPQYATIGTCTNAPIDSTCQLGCLDGYTRTAATGTCVAGTGATAVWSGVSATCTAAFCATVTSYPSHAVVGSCTTNVLFQSCSLSCANGYSPSGSVPGVCTPTGPEAAAWVNQTIVCTAASCPAIVPATGALVGSCGMGSLGQTCQLVCNNGYSTSNLNPGTCTGVGAAAVWQTPFITCSPVSCPPATLPAYAVINTCGTNSLFSTCSLDCADGYQATAIGQGICEPTIGANARWVNSTITCLLLGTVCYNYDGALPSNANIGTCFSAATGSTCALGCDNGYVPTATTGQCLLDNGQLLPTWHSLSVSCAPANCAPVTSFPSHGAAGTCTTAALGSSCALGCANGYVVGNVVSGTCMPGLGPVANWQGQSVTCSPASCPDLPSSMLPAHATIGTCTADVLGAECFVACEPGATPSGDGSYLCSPATGSTAAWAVESPITCSPVQCTPLVSLPSHATVGNCTTADLDSICFLGCADGYALSAATPGSCTTDGSNAVTWQGATATCTAVNCPALTVDDLDANTLPGTCGTSQALAATCNLACADGYVAQGSSPGTCTAGTGPTAGYEGQTITCAAATGDNGALGQVTAPPPAGGSTLILAIVIPIVLVLLLCLVLIVLLARRKKNQKEKPWVGDDATRVFVHTEGTVLFDANATTMIGSGDHNSLSSGANTMSNGVEMSSLMGIPGSTDGTMMGSTRNFSAGLTAGLTGTTGALRTERMTLSIEVDEAAQSKKWEDITVVREVGVGSTGAVTLVRENSTFTEMIYKVYRGADDADKVAAFELQTKVIMTLHNNYVTACFGVMKHDNDVGILTEFMPGGNLKTAVLKPAKLKAALVDACKGLAYIHTRNLVHGHVRPTNILLNQHGVAKLTDICMNAGDGFVEKYAAPEILQGRPATAASDVYAFGLTIGEVYIGRPPFAHVAGVRLQNLAAKPWDNLDYHSVPPYVRAIIEICIETEPARRPTPTDVIEAFNQIKD